MFLSIAQCPPHLRRIGFSPPAIQLRQIDAPVDEHFHPASTAGFPWPSRCIEPDIYPLHQLSRQKHVVITQKDHMVARLSPPDEMRPFLNQGLPGLIRRMGLAGNDELHGTPRISEDMKKPLWIVKQ